MEAIEYEDVYVTNLTTEIPHRQNKVRLAEGSGLEYDAEATPEPRDWELKYAGKKIELPYGSKVRIPKAAAFIWFGAPNLLDSGKNRWRSDEYSKVRNRFGVSAYNEQDFRVIRGTDDGLPIFEVVDADSEQILPMVINDPEGTKVSLGDQALMANATMEEQMKLMMDRLNKLETENQYLKDGEAIAEAAEPAPRVKGSKAPAKTKEQVAGSGAAKVAAQLSNG